MIHRGISTPSKPQTPLWQRLLAPMLLISLGLHGLMLLVPTGSSQDEVIPPPDPEQDSVAITRLPTAAPEDLGEDDATTAARPPVTRTTPGAGSTAPLGGIARIQRSSAGSSTGSGTTSRITPNRNSSRTNPRQSGRSSNTSRSQTSAPAQGSSSRTDQTASPTTESSPRSANQPSAPPSTTVTAPPTDSQPLSPSDLRAQLQAYAAQLNLPQSRIDRLAANLRQRFSYNAAASAEEVLPINQTQWQDRLRQTTGLADLTAEPLPTPLTMVYRQRVCLTPAPGPVKVGLLANPDGTQVEDPVVLQSSGYGAVDARAIWAATEHTLPSADQPKSYILTVEPEVDAGRNPCIDPNAAS